MPGTARTISFSSHKSTQSNEATFCGTYSIEVIGNALKMTLNPLSRLLSTGGGCLPTFESELVFWVPPTKTTWPCGFHFCMNREVWLTASTSHQTWNRGHFGQPKLTRPPSGYNPAREPGRDWQRTTQVSSPNTRAPTQSCTGKQWLFSATQLCSNSTREQ